MHQCPLALEFCVPEPFASALVPLASHTRGLRILVQSTHQTALAASPHRPCRSKSLQARLCGYRYAPSVALHVPTHLQGDQSDLSAERLSAGISAENSPRAKRHARAARCAHHSPASYLRRPAPWRRHRRAGGPARSEARPRTARATRTCRATLSPSTRASWRRSRRRLGGVKAGTGGLPTAPRTTRPR